MKPLKFSNALKAMLVSTAMIFASASAAPIFSDAQSFASSGPDSLTALIAGAADAPMFSHMRLDGGRVAFRGEGNSIMIGHYAMGPWQKNEFLRAWEDIRGNDKGGPPEFVPIPPRNSQLPEPSTLALLGLGLAALGALRRRQSTR